MVYILYDIPMDVKKLIQIRNMDYMIAKTLWND